ncbi:MAG: CDP-alcohol phosphatidyltransferase family protein [Actinomycetaceae bacterium]|nr:CDP-alcohol phosphatidyltransferase family protein [Arcanobacterium sp.]MDD7504849.1 CDP-alcohol phosphatidyltransferase family protein [Actinomycetaceae bacterium]MDY6142795.1 CDP-alcohol phosphatidyltransferase family protein [Arcanobacterium sp.]
MANSHDGGNRGASDAVPLLNIANVLTIVRLILVPVFVVVYWDPTPGRTWWAFAIFVVAAVTDKLDGHFARSRGLITDFGKIADSIADKALIISALVLLSLHGIVWWWVTIVFIVREVAIMALKTRLVMAAGMGGKIKMAAQSAGIALLLVPWASFLPMGAARIVIWAGYVLIGIALVFAITSAFGYVKAAGELLKRRKA